jgi:urease accessory protein
VAETAGTGITARARIVAEPGDGGVTRLPVLSSQVPLVLRRTPEAVYLVGGAAGPLGGDDLTLDIEVRAGASLRVRTAAATIALPSRDGAESVLRVTATVGAGARLEYLPEPVVITDSARHRVEVDITLAEGATLLLRDEVVLGRHGERGGTCLTRLRVNYAGQPLLRHEIAVSGTSEVSLGPAILVGRRTFGSLLLAGPGGHPPASIQDGVAVLPLAGPGVLVTAMATCAMALRRALDGINDRTD